MKDTAKTKKQLIEELDGLRRERAVEQALERVRSIALAMQTTQDLPTVSAAVFREIQGLDFKALTTAIGVADEDRDQFLEWTILPEDFPEDAGPFAQAKIYDGGIRVAEQIFTISKLRQIHPFQKEVWSTDTQDGPPVYLSRHWTKAEFIEAVESLLTTDQVEDLRSGFPTGFEQSIFRHKQSFLLLYLHVPLSPKEIEELKRFVEVFSFVYTRYLDFQQLEQQAEQARRERAVERIRAEAMAMRGSEDLLKVVAVLHQEMNRLGIDTPSTVIVLIDEDRDQRINYSAWDNPEKLGLSWSSSSWVEYDKNTIVGIPVQGSVKKMQDSDLGKKFYESWKNGEMFIDERTIDKSKMVGNLRRTLGLAEDESLIDSYWVRIEGKLITNIPFEYGMISFFFQKGRNEGQEAIVRELAEALSLGYLRFLDFQLLEEQNVQIQEANRLKSDFLARMSHDLRTPMNAIIGYTRILLRQAKEVLNERQYRNLDNIRISANNLLSLINDILDLSKIEAGRIDIKPAAVHLKQLATECIVSVESLVKPGVQLEQQLADVSPVHTDADRIRRVVMNLLSNALKFTEQGSITVSAQLVDGWIELSVADTGSGIPPEDLPHIFDEFRQVEGQEGAQQEGTGLGLSIAKKSVELLGGMIEVESEVGKGTKFTLRITDYEEQEVEGA